MPPVQLVSRLAIPLPRVFCSPLLVSGRRTLSTRFLLSAGTACQVDAHGIPKHPTWCVKDLLESYPCPSISPEILNRIHVLSALVPPAEGTSEHRTLTRELESLVKLVEAVRLVDGITSVAGPHPPTIPDGRVWTHEPSISLSDQPHVATKTQENEERGLLKHASKTTNMFYVVEADKSKRGHT